MVIFTESESICAYSLDINSLLPTFVSENGKKISDSCDGIVSAVKSLSLPVNSDLGYVLVYNRTLYYSVEKAGKHFGTIQINSTVEAVNMQFVMPNMDKWVKERFSDGSYEVGYFKLFFLN